MIAGFLYNGDESQRLADFAAKIEQATTGEITIIDDEQLSKHEGRYIFLDDTNPDFSEYEIKVENGNVILYANYYSLDACINSFFSDMLGYDLSQGKVIGGINLTQGKVYAVEKTSVYTKEKLMSVLEEIYNDDSRLIIGQQMNQTVPIGEVFDKEIEAFREGCGVEPALLGWDCVGTMIYPQNQQNLESARVKIAYQLTEYARSGGVVTLSPHYPNPLDENPVPGNSIKGELGHEDKWEELFDQDSGIYKRFMDYLEQLGDFLEILDKNGVPIIFRNLFEMNGDWTWYCIGQTNENGVEKKIDSQYIKDLYILIYDYLVNTRGLDNLIWLYSPNVMIEGGKEDMGDVLDCYPGDEYVDIIGVDWYPKTKDDLESPQKLLNNYERLVNKTGKLFVFGELSAGDALCTGEPGFTATDYANMLKTFAEKGIRSAYTLAWSSHDSSAGRVKRAIYEMGNGKEFYLENPGFLDKEATKKLLYS